MPWSLRRLFFGLIKSISCKTGCETVPARCLPPVWQELRVGSLLFWVLERARHQVSLAPDGIMAVDYEVESHIMPLYRSVSIYIYVYSSI